MRLPGSLFVVMTALPAALHGQSSLGTSAEKPHPISMRAPASELALASLCATMRLEQLEDQGKPQSGKVVSAAGGESDAPVPLTIKQYRRLLKADLLEAEAKRLRKEGKLAEAIKAARAAADSVRDVYGDHQIVVDALGQVFTFYMEMQDFVAAEKLSRDILALQVRLLGPKHKDVMIARKVVAVMAQLVTLTEAQIKELGAVQERITADFLLMKGPRKAEARRRLQTNHESLRALAGKHPIPLAMVDAIVGVAYAHAGELDVAIPLLEFADAVFSEEIGAQYELANEGADLGHKVIRGWLIHVHARLGQAALDKRDWPAAFKHVEQVRIWSERRHGSDSSEAVDGRLYAGWVKSLATLAPERCQALLQAKALTLQLAEFHERQAWTKGEAAARQALELLTPRDADSNTDYGGVLFWLGRFLRGQGKTSEALDHLSRAYESIAKLKGPRHHDALTANEEWADLAAEMVETALNKNNYQVAKKLAADILALRQRSHPANHWKVTNAQILGKRVVALEQLPAKHAAMMRGLTSAGKHIGALLQKGDHAASLAAYQSARRPLADIAGSDLFLPSLFELPAPFNLPGARAQALPLYQDFVQVSHKTFGRNHPTTFAAERFVAWILQAAGRSAEALQHGETALDIACAVFGEDSWEACYVNGDLGFRQQALGNLVAAEKHHRKALDIAERRGGENSAGFLQCLQNLAVACRLKNDYAEAEKLFRKLVELRRAQDPHGLPYADSLNSLAFLLVQKEEFATAEKLFLKSLILVKKNQPQAPLHQTLLANLADVHRLKGNIAQADHWLDSYLSHRRQALGAGTLAFASLLDNTASYYMSGGNFRFITFLGRQAEVPRIRAMLTQALELRRQLLPGDHPDLASSLHNLGILHRLEGDFVQAESYFLQALDIRQKKLPDPHFATASTLNSLAVVYIQKGDLVRAEPLQQKAVAMYVQLFGPNHPQAALSRTNLARIYTLMGDYTKAETLLRQDLIANKQSLGDRHPNFAAVVGDLAALYRRQGDQEQAELFQQYAVRLARESLGSESAEYGSSLLALARLSLKGDQHEQALGLAQQALTILKAQGEQSLSYASALFELGQAHAILGALPEAEKFLAQALVIRKQVLGPKHPEVGDTLLALGKLLDRKGDFTGAARHLQKALDVTLEMLQLTAAMQSERQQLQMVQALRDRLDAYLSVAARAKVAPETTYAYLLAWKGAVFARQQQLRLARVSEGSKTAQLVAQLQKVTSELATLAYVTPNPKEQAEWQKQFQRLSDAKEGLEADLSRLSPSFRALQAQKVRSATDLLKALPRETALIDFLEYSAHSYGKDGKGHPRVERRLLAFVLEPGQTLKRLDLGSADAIEENVDLWRAELKKRQPGQHNAGGELRRLVWAPVQKEIARASIVLISPDGALARLPFAALPGTKAGSFLLEEVALAVLPTPQLLPELLGLDAAAAKTEPLEPSLLLLGDVDFGARPQEMAATSKAGAPLAARTGSLSKWQSLPGTRDEVLALKDSFTRRFPKGRLTLLQQGDASEHAFRSLAARHRWLHLATHGFFAPAVPTLSKNALATDSFRGEAIGFHPGLLSGLVLAGANHPPKIGQDDNILTALEVAELDLRGVSLAVLSACETGLGKVAGGEGVLGLQRAFQISGVHSVVASLWTVPDQPTRVLMERFYDNLWHKKLTKLEALREAQLWMLREGRAHPGVVRGLILDDQPLPPAADGRLPPYFWAAFVLSGGWR